MAVRSAEAPAGRCRSSAWAKTGRPLQSSGYFSYWSDRSQPAVYAAPEMEAIAPQDVGEPLPSDSQVRQRGGETASDKGDGVKISKTIQGTEVENVFDITLTVKTPTEASVFFEEPDIAVVIVMDISNTMNSNFGGTTRYGAAMDARASLLILLQPTIRDLAELATWLSIPTHVRFSGLRLAQMILRQKH